MNNFKAFFALVLLLAMAVELQAGVILYENFEDGVADGWNLNAAPGTSSTIIDTGGNTLDTTANSLRVATGSLYQIAETPVFDLTTATYASIIFDYLDDDGGATRFTTIDFFNGTSWVQLADFRQTAAFPDGRYTVTATSGFAVNSRFRFEGKNQGSGGQRNQWFDNIVIRTDADLPTVPEPGSLVLCSLVGIALGFRRLRRGK